MVLKLNLDANKLFTVNISDFDDLASDKNFVVRQIHNWMGIMFENNFAQYQIGLLTDVYWKQQAYRLKTWCEKYDLRPINQQVNSFQAYLDSLPDECTE